MNNRRKLLVIRNFLARESLHQQSNSSFTMTASVRILTTSSVDSNPAILLVEPDGSKILINCGEGSQRSFLDSQQRVSTVKAVCLTHLSYESIGGLPGMILTASDVQNATIENAKAAAAAKVRKSNNSTQLLPPFPTDTAQGLNVFGPEGTNSFLKSLRHFMRRDSFRLNVHEGLVEGIRVCLPKTRKRKSGQPVSEGAFFSVKSFPFVERRIGDRKRSRTLPERKTLSYLFWTPRFPGKFMANEAKRLGVPKGPMYGMLKSGNSVTFSDASGEQRTVTSNQTVQPDSPGIGVAVLRYPEDFFEEQLLVFFKQMTMKRVISSVGVELEIAIHIASRSSFGDKIARQWRDEFPSTVQHLLLDTDISADSHGTPFRSAAHGALCRSLVCPDLYVQVREPNTLRRPYGPELARAGSEFVLLPRGKVGFSDFVDYNIDDGKEKARTLVKDSGASTLAKELLAECALCVNESFSGELFFTGTGSAIPCKHRNVSGICLTSPNGNSILLDVGEGTVGQLLRANSGPTSSTLAHIKAVWISHPHADHHLGILRLLHDRKAPDPLLLMCPSPIISFLTEYCSMDSDLSSAYVAVNCNDLIRENAKASFLLKEALGIDSSFAVPVTHCPYSFGLILEGTCFGKLVYSGDCRPSSQLAKCALGADLLIHEATFEDGMEVEATLKRHSTIGEALSVGMEMKAKCVVLTHFSQRYPKVPPTPVNHEGSIPVIFAFDFMRLSPSNLVMASKVTPAIRLLYPEESEGRQGAETEAESIMAIPGLFAQSELL